MDVCLSHKHIDTRAHLKHKLVDAQLHGSYEHRVECLIACLVFGRAYVYNLPFELWARGCDDECRSPAHSKQRNFREYLRAMDERGRCDCANTAGQRVDDM